MIQTELLCIDQEDIVKFKKPKNFIRSLSTIECLWKGDLIISEDDLELKDELQGIKISIQLFDTSKMVTGDRFLSAYLISIEGEYPNLEPFRLKFIEQLKDLNFKHVRIISDDVSTTISLEIYPLINEIENKLRKYIVKFFIAKIGTDWWTIAIPKETREKSNQKRSNETVFTNTHKVIADVTLITFDQLGKIIYSQSSIFTKVDDIIEKIKSAADLELLKQELLEGNYAKYFKDTFEQKDFEKKWISLTFIRNKVAHNNYFVQKDLDDTKALCAALKQIIDEAESSIDQLTLSIADKEAVKKVIDDITVNENDEINKTESSVDKGECTQDLIDEVEKTLDKYPQPSIKAIEESNILKLLEEYQSKMQFVGMKYFVREVLGVNGYQYNSAYTSLNLLADKGKIEIYVEPNPFGDFDTTAIRLKK